MIRRVASGEKRRWEAAPSGRQALLASAGWFLLVFLLIGAAPADPARAETLYVDQDVPVGTGSSCASPGYISIQPAVNAAHSGDTIFVCGSPAPYVNGSVPFDPTILDIGGKVLTLRGAGPGQTVLDGQNDRALISGRATLTIEEMTIQNGRDPNDGGAVEVYNGLLTIRGVHFRDNEATGFGRGGGAISASTVLIEDSLFQGNTADSPSPFHPETKGGAVLASGDVTVIDSVFSDNRVGALDSGGRRDGLGGAIYANGVFVSGSELTDNVAEDRGGAVAANTVNAIESRFTGNSVTGVDGRGGSVFSFSTVLATGSTFSQGTASSGAGIYADGYSYVELVGSTLSGNLGSSSGVHAREVRLTNSTVNGNSGDGVITATDSGNIELNGATVAGNAIAGAGGTLTTDTGELRARNSVIDEVILGGLPACNSSLMQDLGGNVVSDDSDGCEGLVGGSVGNMVPSAEIGLGALADNGGPTRTMRLADSSVALDQGVPACLSQDQRGVDRTQPCDAGAFELAWNVEVDRTGTGSGSVESLPVGIECGVTCIETFPNGVMVSLTADPDDDSTFTGWTGPCSGTGTCTVTMSQTRKVGAQFTVIPDYELTVARGGSGRGTIASSTGEIDCGSSCSATYASPTEVTLTATPAEGSTFDGWSGACSGTGTCRVTMDQTRTVQADFGSIPNFSLTVQKGGDGRGTVTSLPSGIDCGPTCSVSLPSAAEMTLIAEPSEGSSFVEWTGACSGSGPCVVAMDRAKTVRARFAVKRNRGRPSLRLGGRASSESVPVTVGCGGPASCRLRVTGFVRGPGNTQGSPKLVSLVSISAGTKVRVEVLKSNLTSDPMHRKRVLRLLRTLDRPIFDVTALDVTTGRLARLAVDTTTGGARPENRTEQG